MILYIIYIYTVVTISITFFFIWAHWGSRLNWSLVLVDSFGHAGPRLCRPRHTKAIISPDFQGQKLQSVDSPKISLKIIGHAGHRNCWLNKRIWETTNYVAHLETTMFDPFDSILPAPSPSFLLTSIASRSRIRCSGLVMVMRSSMMGDPQQTISGWWSHAQVMSSWCRFFSGGYSFRFRCRSEYGRCWGPDHRFGQPFTQQTRIWFLSILSLH